MSSIRCVWFEPAQKISRHLRRFSFDRKCQGHETRTCDAMVFMDIIPCQDGIISVQEKPPTDDPRWPLRCDTCGVDFTMFDQWQVFCDRIYKNTETGEELLLRDLPAGAMFDSYWVGKDCKGPDGKAITLILPDKTPWIIDGFAYNNGQRTAHGWTRTGTPPNITASPSILTPGYHGWLKDGVLTEC